MIQDSLKAIEDVTKLVDSSIYSMSEAEADRTSRHIADMTSDNVLSKMIRPVLAIGLFLIWGFLVIFSIWKEIQSEALYSSTAAMMTAIGFYFESRRGEKIIAKKVAAAIQIEKVRNRRDFKMKKRK